MPEKFRYAIWAAVSSEAQATPDKYGLPVQIARCREYDDERGRVVVKWKEV